MLLSRQPLPTKSERDAHMAIIRSEQPRRAASLSERDIDLLDSELVAMDADVVAYLKDPATQPPPDYERLIGRIQSLPERSDSPRSLTLKISNLKYKAHYFARAWGQIRENVAEVDAALARGERIPKECRKETYFCAPTHHRRGRLEARGVRVVDMLYDMQQMKLAEHGLDDETSSREPKAAFKARIAAQYQRIKEAGQGGRKVVLVWNPEERHCDLIVDRRSPA